MMSTQPLDSLINTTPRTNTFSLPSTGEIVSVAVPHSTVKTVSVIETEIFTLDQHADETLPTVELLPVSTMLLTGTLSVMVLSLLSADFPQYTKTLSTVGRPLATVSPTSVVTSSIFATFDYVIGADHVDYDCNTNKYG